MPVVHWVRGVGGCFEFEYSFAISRMHWQDSQQKCKSAMYKYELTILSALSASTSALFNTTSFYSVREYLHHLRNEKARTFAFILDVVVWLWPVADTAYGLVEILLVGVEEQGRVHNCVADGK